MHEERKKGTVGKQCGVLGIEAIFLGVLKNFESLMMSFRMAGI